MLNIVETSGTGLREPAGAERTPALPAGVRVQRTATSFELRRDAPSAQAVYYRLDYGRLEWSDDLRCFTAEGRRPTPDPGLLLTQIQGASPAPASTSVAGVQRLTVGTRVRVDADGVSVTRHRPEPARRPQNLLEAVGAALAGIGGDYAIAYSGGLGSAFLAAAALAAGHRPTLVHADIGPAAGRPLPVIPGLPVRRFPIDPTELLDHNGIGDEPAPPVPDVEAPRRLGIRLAAEIGLPLVGGGLLEDLVSVRLPDVDTGVRNWRLLTCEPFHIAGTLRGLEQARGLLGKAVVYVPGGSGHGHDLAEAQPADAVVVPPSPNGVSAVPGITADGRQALESAHRGTMALWKDHLEFVGPVLGRATAGLAERGDVGTVSPAVDPGVLAAVSNVPAARIGRLRHGMFRNHLPLQRPLSKLAVTGLRRAAPGVWLRLAAATHLHRERKKLAAELERGCALADLGMVDVRAALGVLADGRALAENALPLLRLIWIDRWLRGVS